MLLKGTYQTELSAKLTALLEKIRLNSGAGHKNRFLIMKSNLWRFKGSELTSFTVDETQATGTIVLDAGSAFGVTGEAATFQSLTFTTRKVGEWYPNNKTIRITYIDPGVDGALSVAVSGDDINVTLAYGSGAVTSTIDDVKAAIIASEAANALVTISGSSGSLAAAQAQTTLTGGTSTQTYDKADIVSIRRLRTKKYMIELNGNANPA